MSDLSLAPHAGTYRDRKKIFWIMSLLGPAAAVIGPVLHLTGYRSAFAYVAGALFLYAFIPMLDYLLGEDSSNPPEEAVPRLEGERYYKAVLYLLVPALWAAVAFNAWFLCTHSLRGYEWLGTALITGSLLGEVLTVSHELGHKRAWLDRKLALLSSAIGGYGHFSIEHNRGHHRDVATPLDPASSRMGESVYRFASRELPGCFMRAWKLETKRVARAGRHAWSLHNEIVQGWLLTAAIHGAALCWLGVRAIPVLATISLWGAFQLTLANYVEHYGLLRSKQPDGRYERCKPHHSWNSNHVASNVILFHLQRHSDHHANASRSYQSLRNFPSLPSLPSGYFGMFVVALIPPLWFYVMDARLLKVVDRDPSRINFRASKRAELLEKHQLQQLSPSVT